jgi:hypothetical protein
MMSVLPAKTATVFEFEAGNPATIEQNPAGAPRIHSIFGSASSAARTSGR